jgi:predicted metal-binding protein
VEDGQDKDYVIVVQCHIVKERCPGYACEKAFHERTGGFTIYPAGKPQRALYLTCGGCCGLSLHRTLAYALRSLRKQEEIPKDRIAVQLSSCMTLDNYHGPPCPHLDYIKSLIARLGVDVFETTVISDKAQERRDEGRYAARE